MRFRKLLAALLVIGAAAVACQPSPGGGTESTAPNSASEAPATPYIAPEAPATPYIAPEASATPYTAPGDY
jgi:hypothetical protein